MHDTKPSLTALLVAAARAIPGPLPPVDPQLGAQLGGKVGAALDIVASHKATALLARTAGLALVDHIQLRTAALDAAVEQAVHAGCRQVVVLGAGYDRRAWRLATLRECAVWEVDHPATQAEKRRQLQDVPAKADRVVWAAVDFARDDLGAQLAVHGHDPGQPTLWLWEGVTMYLPEAAQRATLAVLHGRSAPGSWLALSYLTPQLLPGGKLAKAVAARVFASIGEPLVGALSRTQMRGLLATSGFEVTSDSANPDWAGHFGGNAAATVLFRCERVAVARRPAGVP
ncbi:MAG: SAM-dependent methyltransferase [Deltaproteobacteria bacterium]|nr:SAM-dependent methyltransferase [Deltaproteobacteria bacterium]